MRDRPIFTVSDLPQPLFERWLSLSQRKRRQPLRGNPFVARLLATEESDLDRDIRRWQRGQMPLEGTFHD
jgi:hypothetical protein